MTQKGWVAPEGAGHSRWVNHLACQGDQVLARFSDGSVWQGERQLGRACGWPKDWTSCVGKEPDGDTWAGTYSAFYLNRNGRWQIHAPKPALQGILVTGLARLEDKVWVGSQSGLFEYDLGTHACRQVSMGNGLTDSWVTGVAVFGGKVWAGTFGGGLCVLGPQGCWTHYRVGTSSLTSDRIHCLLSTRQGVWLGTPEGLVWTDGAKWRCFTTADGLPGDTVWSLASRDRQLWVGTDCGLCRVDLDQVLKR